MVVQRQIRHPTQAESRRAIRVAVVVVLLGIALLPLLWLLDDYIASIGALEQEDAVAAMRQLVYVLAILIILFSSGVATWMWRLAAKIRLTGQYPPPDVMIVRPIEIRRDKDAERIAAIVSLASTLLLLLGFAVAVLLVGIVEMLV
jgi:hypothetical protein|tara:strand:- start:4642 stop:5079 length:438 start_codon:yes stop_codon:yes gene_type:complete